MRSDMTLERKQKKVEITDAQLQGFDQALRIFKKAANNVPAYKDFLNRRGVKPEKIKTLADFKTVPIITKENYLKKYSFHELMWRGGDSDVRIISTSSGSSGQPFFWPRGNKSVDESVIILDNLLDKTFNTKNVNTLCINAFAMGTWIAGTYMSSAMWRLGDMGHKIVTVTPGITKEEIVRELEVLSPQFKQTIIMGYPPFVKDVVDFSKSQGVKLARLDIKCLFAGENFSEQWRDYILAHIGKKGKPESTLGIYGTADAGIVGIETPWSVYLRRLSFKKINLHNALFGNTSILPTLVQYNPRLRYVEEVDGKIVFTADNSLPLIRYEILDEGQVVTPEQVTQSLSNLREKIPATLQRFATSPYIALYGRQDVAAIFYALNIYPENIKYGLESHALHESVTGKFVIQSHFDGTTQEQTLHLDIELKQGVRPDAKLERKVFKAIVGSLTTNNSEYNKLHQELGKKAEPIIHLIAQGGEEFKISIKQKWVRK